MSIHNEYNQRPEESLEDWRYRIIFDKIEKKVDMSWAEICTYLGLPCSGEYLRKNSYAVYRYHEYTKEKQEEAKEAYRETKAFNELEEKEMELRKQKMQMQDQKRELNKSLREWARADHIKDEICKAIENIPKLPHKNHKKIEKIQDKKQDGVLLLSDWHVGQNCSNINNVYNDNVFQSRVTELADRVIEYGHQNGINALHVFCLGDFINGLIHVTTRINNTENVIKQSMLAAETLCKLVNLLSEEFNKVKIYFARGNHDRVSASKKESLAGESFFDLIPWYLEARIEGIPNIKVVKNTVDEEIISADIYGKKVFGVHGHRDKMNKAVQNISAVTRIIPDYIFMGHFHHTQEEDVNGTEVIVNGSLCGTDEYAMNLRRTAKVSQKFMIFDETGRVCTYDIQLK